MARQAVTIYTLARELGLHPSTVSRVFSRPALVKDSVRERVRARAGELGYQPNVAARGLITGRLGMIGLLIPDIENPFFPPLIRAIQKAATDRDLSVLLVDCEQRPSREIDLIAQIRNQIDGIVLASPRSTMHKVSQAVGDTPLVLVNRIAHGAGATVVDNSAALHDAGDHLYAGGHRRFALLRGPFSTWAARRRASAVDHWATHHDVGLDRLGPFDASYDGGREAAAEIARCAVTAVFAFDDLMACGVVAGLKERGVDVPADVSLVGCDDVLLARTLTPALTTITAPFTDVGTSAVEQLHALIEGDHVEQAVVHEGRLTLRASTRPVRAYRA